MSTAGIQSIREDKIVKRAKVFFIFSMAFVLILAACAPAEVDVPITGTDGVGAPTTGEALQAIQAAQDFLANQLGVSSADIQVVETDPMDFTDSCLGLGGPAEICAQVITPGYRVTLTVDGQQYVVHTDQVGEVVRLAENNQ
jgi:hypothetical protein